MSARLRRRYVRRARVRVYPPWPGAWSHNDRMVGRQRRRARRRPIRYAGTRYVTITADTTWFHMWMNMAGVTP